MKWLHLLIIRLQHFAFTSKHIPEKPTQYLTEIRIGYACKLLGEGNLDVNEICMHIGFNNLSHFHKQFEKIVKFTPSEYQRRSSLKDA